MSCRKALARLKKKGTVTSNAAFANVKVTGNVTQATPTNLSNVTITGTLAYNTNTSAAISKQDLLNAKLLNEGDENASQ